MSQPEVHPMTAEWVTERQTMRYTCPACRRCVEDGPDGLRVLHTGNPEARHVGGVLKMTGIEVEPSPPIAPPQLH